MSSIEKISSVFRRGLFKNKVAIVTGGATGIGNAITKELLFLGCDVVIASRKKENLEKAEKELNHRFPSQTSKKRLSAFQCNVRKEDEVKSLMEDVLKTYGKIDFLVNNGGGQFPSPAADISLKGWNAVIETNLTGTFLMCREVYDSWMRENGGVIVNIISDMFRGFPIMAHSGAARSGVDNLTKSLAVEWAENGIRVNAVVPGSSIYSDTAIANYANVDPEIFQKRIPSIPAKRLGTTQEVSGAVLFLLTPAASFISGETVKVDAASSLYGQSFWNIPEHKNLPPYKWSEDTNCDEDSDPPNKSKL